MKADSPAQHADIRQGDFITRINGQIVFHMNPRDIERLLNDPSATLLLDIERYVRIYLTYIA